jgi:hypothetical protein
MTAIIIIICSTYLSSNCSQCYKKVERWHFAFAFDKMIYLHVSKINSKKVKMINIALYLNRPSRDTNLS